MKSFTSLVATLAIAHNPTTAFVSKSSPVFRAKSILNAKPVMTPELETAIGEVRECAQAFGEETAHFANVWIDRTLEGNQEGTAAAILDECILDDEDGKCERFAVALEKLDELLGVVAKEQF